MPHASPVRLHADLQEAVRRPLGDGFDAQAGRVGVRADYGDGVAGFPCGADGEGDEGAGVAGEVVFAAGLDGGGPGIAFLPEALVCIRLNCLHLPTLICLKPAFSRRCLAEWTAWNAAMSALSV